MRAPNTKCICEICCCGRHKCPHRPKAPIPWGPCVLSEYNAQYHPHSVQPDQPIRPTSNLLCSKDPLSNTTTHRTDYVPYKVDQPFKRKPETYKAPEGIMEGTTLYREEYTPKHCPPAQTIKPIQRKQCPAKFDAQPTYRTDYRPWELPPIGPIKPKQDKAPLPKFEGEPIYRTEYVAKCAEKMPSCKPEVKPLMSEPFKGDTLYRTEYVAHPVEPPPPPKPKTYAKSRVPFETLTTNRKDYTPKEFCPNMPIRPPGSLMCSTGPMSSDTTNRLDYKDWGPQIIEPIRPPAYRAPEGDLTFDSTYRNDFDEKPICPSVPIKRCQPKRCEAKFDGTTNYRSDYTPWAVKPPASTNKQAQWSPPEIPMDDKTTTGTTYTQHPCVNIPESFKPKPTCIDSGPFDGRTNYRIEYVPKQTCPVCPAGFLESEGVSPDGYVFDHYDERGHKRYKNLGAGKALQPVTVK